MDKASLIKLGLIAAKADANAPVAYAWNNESYSYEQVNEALRAELKEIAGTYALFRENKNTIFSFF